MTSLIVIPKTSKCPKCEHKKFRFLGVHMKGVLKKQKKKSGLQDFISQVQKINTSDILVKKSKLQDVHVQNCQKSRLQDTSNSTKIL